MEKAEGVQRRLEIKGSAKGIIVIDDYGHHPTEIKTTLDALEKSWPGRRKIVVFQPHRYSRTEALFDDFTRSFYLSDILIVLPIYPAGERPRPGVSSQLLCDSIQAHGHKDVRYSDHIEKTADLLQGIITDGDVVLTMGAGNVWQAGELLLKQLKA